MGNPAPLREPGQKITLQGVIRHIASAPNVSKFVWLRFIFCLPFSTFLARRLRVVKYAVAPHS